MNSLETGFPVVKSIQSRAIDVVIIVLKIAK